MDKLDVKIINHILENKSLKYKKLAKDLGITIGTVHNRIKKLEGEKIFQGTLALIDSKKIGYSVVAIIHVTIKGGKLEKIENKYSKHKNVCSVYDITGDYDSLIVAKFKSTDELNAFVKKLMAEPEVERTVTSLVLNVVKESFVPFPVE